MDDHKTIVHKPFQSCKNPVYGHYVPFTFSCVLEECQADSNILEDFCQDTYYI